MEPRERISNLPCFHGIKEIVPLTSGLTNEIFRVTDGSGCYVARFADDIKILGIDREVELNCLKTAAAVGIAPPILYTADGVIVMEFVDGDTLTPESAGREEVLRALVNGLHVLHDPLHELGGRVHFVSPLQSISKHIAAINEHNIPVTGDINYFRTVARTLYGSLPAYVPALCHADLVGANIIFNGKKLWLIDWEYSGMGDPLFDLGWFSVANELSGEACELLLHLYFGAKAERMSNPFGAMRILCALRDALWAVVQTYGSSLDLDYHEHARKYFDIFRSLLSCYGHSLPP